MQVLTAVLLGTAPLQAAAECLRPSWDEPGDALVLSRPMSVLDVGALVAWGTSIGNHSWDHYQCAPLAEFPDVALCLFSHGMMMNRVFARVVAEIESARHHRKQDNRLLGVDLKISQIDAASHDDLPRCHPAEGYFRASPLQQLKRAGIDNIIAAAWGNLDTIEHELLHAQYFSDIHYSDIIQSFWHNTLNTSQRSQVRQSLGSHYDADNEDLMINEFQAYVLQSAPRGWLLAEREHWRDALLAELSAANRPPLALTSRLAAGAAP